MGETQSQGAELIFKRRFYGCRAPRTMIHYDHGLSEARPAGLFAMTSPALVRKKDTRSPDYSVNALRSNPQ